MMIVMQSPIPVNGGILSANTIVLNEFMPHPQCSSTEADGEWVELYNNTNEWINLSGWTLQNGIGEEITLSTYLLPPDGFYILAACGNENLNGGITPNYVYCDFTIFDSGSLTLLSASRAVVDKIEYDGSWSIQPGISCERINPGWVSNLSSTWDYSTLIYGNGDMGTPGDENSVYVNSFAQNSWAFIKAFVQ